jgi:hypothetical protein
LEVAAAKRHQPNPNSNHTQCRDNQRCVRPKLRKPMSRKPKPAGQTNEVQAKADAAAATGPLSEECSANPAPTDAQDFATAGSEPCHAYEAESGAVAADYTTTSLPVEAELSQAEASAQAKEPKHAEQAEQPELEPEVDGDLAASPGIQSNVDNLPAPVDGRNALPTSHERARQALAECESIVECKDWADRAAAMAHYAHIAKDTELAKHAVRIRALAIRRVGELLLEIHPDPGGRPPRSENSGGHSPEFSGDALNSVDKTMSPRAAAAKASGMSVHQAKEAMRVATIPQKRFERQVSSANPPSLTTLAKQGTRRRTAPTAPAGDRGSADEVVGEDAVKRAIAAMQATHTFDHQAREFQAFARVAARLPRAMVGWAADLLAHLMAAAST